MTASLSTIAPARIDSAPAPMWTHLLRLSDDTGLFEHARNSIVRREHGYCVDDVGRGLLVVSREPAPSTDLLRLADVYLGFLNHAQSADGKFRNRLSHGRLWSGAPDTGDWWGRALWGLGTAAACCEASWIREEALAAFEQGAGQRSVWPRAMAVAGLGAAEVLRAHPGHPQAAALLADAATAAGTPGEDPAWAWPEPVLTYANAALAEVVVAAGDLLGEPVLLDNGLRMLRWLVESQTRADGRLSMVPVAGWRQGTPRGLFDQQPIEVAHLADACATAAEITGDAYFERALGACVAWFLGENDGEVVMYDARSGGGFDGLTPVGPNRNQGAESTIAFIVTMQHARALATRNAIRASGGAP